MAEELKRHGLTFSLDLNKHPKDATNLSLINAENFKVSEDGASLVADRNLLENEVIKNTLDEYYSQYNDLSEGESYKIVNCIPANDEIVLFVENTKVLQNGEQIVIKSENSNEDNLNYSKIINIFRYNEKINVCKIIDIQSQDVEIFINKFININDYQIVLNSKWYHSSNIIDKDDDKYIIKIDGILNVPPEYNELYLEFKYENEKYIIDKDYQYELKNGDIIKFPYEIQLKFIETENGYTFTFEAIDAIVDNISIPENNNTLIFKHNNIQYSYICNKTTYNINKAFIKQYINYYDGKFSGTFTYNVKNELIIAFCEYDNIRNTEFECGEPLKIINLGYWENNIVEEGIDNWILINNSNLDPRTFAICPEVTIPKITEWSIEQGLSKKGWYHFYIRYKINNYDYTQWFDFGRAFYLDESKEQIIFKYPVNDKTTGVGETYKDGDWKISSIISDNTDICNKTIKFNLSELNDIYNFYQIGFICNTKIYSECKITDDIDISNNTFQLNYKNCNNYDINQIIKTYNNYYNVKNIINYNNRLYISNYKNKDILSEIKQNINFKIIEKNSDITNTIKIKLGNEIKTLTLENNKIKAKDIYGVEKLYSYKEKFDKSDISKGHAYGEDLSMFEYHCSNISRYNLVNGYNDSIKNLTSIYLLRANGKSHNFPEEKNSTMLNGEARKIVDNYWCKRIYFYYDEYHNIIDISDYEFIYDSTNNTLYCDQLMNDVNVIGSQKEILENVHHWVENYTDYIEYPTILKTFTPIVEIDKLEDLNNSFTLIPRQPYCFYIHYVDKYGNVTDGLPIRNMMYETTSYLDGPGYYIHNNKEKYVTIGSICNNSNVDYCKYFVFIMAKLNESLPIFDGVKFKNHKLNLNKLLFNVIYLNGEETNDIYEYNDLKNISTIANNDGEIKTFKYLFEDSENDGFDVNRGSLFHLYSDIKYSHLPAYQFVLLNSFINKNYNYGYLSDNSFWILNDYKDQTSIEFNNIIIPKNYVSYFISYEKLDKIQLFEGIIKDSKFYSDTLNYKDKLEIGVNIDSNDNIISKIEYKVANSFKDDNFGKSSNLKITYEKEDAVAGNYLYKYPINIYSNTNKNLLRITEISKESLISTNTYGFYSQYGSVITKKPFRINSANKLINSDDVKLLTENPLYVDTTSTKLFTYIPDSSKQINNSPKIYKTNISEVNFDNPKADFYDSYLFLPQDTIDLFKNNALDYDESVLSIYVNYNENNINQTDFVKTIRRSTYIKDESLENGWRTFESEAYQNIQENKGEITRIEGIGDLLLVHTKDSLFQFDKSNLLMTSNKNVQLAQGDTFDVSYKEIVTSKNGFGGLQDKEAAIVGEFGYIWYNNDFNKIYQYDAGSLNVISGNIEFLLNRYKPTKCKFVDDKQNKRLLIQFLLNNNQVLNLTYNYDAKAFISFYINEESENNLINEVYNTKTKFYILENNKIFSGFENPNAKKLSFIINENYTKIKRLNYIKYKLYKRIDSSNEEFDANLPVEGNALSLIDERRPYSGYQLRVYNDLCSTEELDIQVDLKSENNIDIKKPYYDLGNFTFNYLRDKDTNSQIFGNFFIVEFSFEDNQEDIIEFESLEYGINYEEN